MVEYGQFLHQCYLRPPAQHGDKFSRHTPGDQAQVTLAWAARVVHKCQVESVPGHLKEGGHVHVVGGGVGHHVHPLAIHSEHVQCVGLGSGSLGLNRENESHNGTLLPSVYHSKYLDGIG